jgi:hypothetical protein
MSWSVVLAGLVLATLLLAWYYPAAIVLVPCAIAGALLGRVDGNTPRFTGGAAKLSPFTYNMPPDAKSVVTAITVAAGATASRATVTPYYTKGKLYLTKPKTARQLGYKPEDVIHSEDANHNETLHAPTDPYQWHGHLDLPLGEVVAVIRNLLRHYGPKAPVHIGRIAKAFEGNPKPTSFPDGARLTTDVCNDKSGLEFMIDVRKRWGERPPLTSEEYLWMAEAVGNIRYCTGARVVLLLLQRFHPEEVLRWVGYQGLLQHYLARVGCLEGLKILASSPFFDINAQRADGGTVAHLASMKLQDPAKQERGMKLLEFAKAHGADLTIKNKIGETPIDSR